MQKAFKVVKLKSVFSSPKPTGLASEVPRHLVHTPPTRTHPHYRPWVTYSDNFDFTQTLRSTRCRDSYFWERLVKRTVRHEPTYILETDTFGHSPVQHVATVRSAQALVRKHPPPPSQGPSGRLLGIDIHVWGVTKKTNSLFLLSLLCHLQKETNRQSFISCHPVFWHESVQPHGILQASCKVALVASDSKGK